MSDEPPEMLAQQAQSPTVAELKQPTTFAGFSPRVEHEIERTYWEMLAKKDPTQTDSPKTDRDAFKWAVREMFQRLRS